MITSRTRWTLTAAAALALTAGACADSTDQSTIDPADVDAVPEAAPGELAITLATPSSVVATRDAVNVTVTMTNVASHPVRVLRYQTPLDGIKEDLFKVTRDGVAIEYLGRHYKWAAPQPEDFISLDRGQSVVATVDLATAYDFATTGTYFLAYGAGDVDNISGLVGGISVQVEGRQFVVPGGANLTTTGCSSSRITSLTTAYSSARTMASSALSYLTNTTPSGTPRYTTWFGSFTSTGWSTAHGS